ncbi:MAG TPA: tubulin-like doman-containing protein [Aquihabitans sp.]|jgi:hypothetical protein|nr:tubulin-like doman-containing protein [Aquihabitans sp.]
MLRPIIFVGCGGSGGKTLRVARRAILRRLERVGWTGGMPAAWQFLHIDVPAGQEGSVDDFGPYLPAQSYMSLVEQGTEYSGVDQELIRKIEAGAGDGNAELHELLGWRPNPRDIHVPIEKGAGQYRAVGRIISINSARAIGNAVRSLVNAVNTNVAQEQLRQVSEKLQFGQGNLDSPLIILVSSLAGGTGAGCFMDVADIIRAEGGVAGDDTMAVLYTSDVFRDVQGVEGVHGNSLAAIAELLAGYWGQDSRDMRILQKQGVTGTEVTRGGPAYPFLVGAANTAGVSLKNQVEVYRAIGEGLAMVVVAGKVQEDFANFLAANWTMQANGNEDSLGLTPRANRYGAASSLGYARLGLGRDRFRDYAIRRLARDAAEFLNEGYIAAAQANWPDQQLTPVEARERTVEFHSEAFLNALQLNERNHADAENNQIIDAIRPDALAGEWQQVVATVLNLLETLPAADISVWLKRIADHSEALHGPYLNDVRVALAASATRWADEVPEVIVSEVARYVAAHGVPVTVGLIENTIREVRAVANDLYSEAASLRVEGGNWMGRIGTFAPTGTNLQASYPQMPDIVREATSPWYYEGEAMVRGKAAELMLELADAILTPLLGTLKAAQRKLESGLAPRPDGRPSDVLGWPRGEEVPASFLPSKVELLLDEPSTYPGCFAALVDRTLGGDPAARELGPLVAARRQVIAGGFASAATDEVPHALRHQDRDSGTARVWRPRAVGGNGQASQFAADFDIDSLLDRSRAWIERPGSFKVHLDESLADYLRETAADGTPIEDHTDRLSAFRAKFSSALDLSAPLISIDRTVFGKTHPLKNLADVVSEVIEPLPFPTGHPARAVAEDILKARLAARGEPNADVSGFFVGDSGAGIGSVGIVSYIGIPVHPVVFSSVFGPIAAKFQQGSAGFWQWRRTRTLTEAIPVSSDVRRSMIRGWYTARLLGMLDTAERTAAYQVYDLRAGWVPFPFPLLGSVPRNDALDQLAAVLESMPLAFLSWGVWAEERPVAAYRRLLTLGLEDPENPDELAYKEPGDELQAWLDGKPLPAGCRAVGPLDGLAHEERPKATEEFLRQQVETYRALVAEPLRVEKLTATRRGLELAQEIATTLEGLADAVATVDTAGITF